MGEPRRSTAEHITAAVSRAFFLYIATFVSAGLSELVHFADGVIRGVADDVVGASLEVGGIEFAHEVEQVGHLAKGGWGVEG